MGELSHFLFTSDCPVDKIGYVLQDSITIPSVAYQAQFFYFNTHVKTTLYPEGDYTIEGDSNTYAFSYSIESGTALLCAAASFMLNDECWIGIAIMNLDDSKVGKKLNFRLWAYVPETDAKNTDINPTASVTKPKLVFTSDENYPKFIGDGFINKGGTYTHSLGYIPFIKTWQRQSMTISNPTGGGTITRDVNMFYTATFFGPVENMYDGDRSHIVRTTSSQIITYTGTTDYIGTYYRMYSI